MKGTIGLVDRGEDGSNHFAIVHVRRVLRP
jgi:hypothetical protein